MQFTADLLALLLVSLQKLMGQVPQLLLHPTRLRQQLAEVLLAFPERVLDCLALTDLQFQRTVGGGEFPGTPAQRLVQLTQLDVGSHGSEMSLCD